MRYRIFTGYLRLYRLRFTGGILLLLVTNLLALSIPLLVKRTIDSLSGHPTAAGVLRDSLAIAAVALVQAFARTWSRLVMLGASRLVAYDLRRRLFERLLVLPPSWFDRMRTGDIMSRAVNDMQLIRSLFGPGMMNFANTIIAYAGSITIMAWINPRLCLLALVPYPIVLLSMNRLSRTLYRRSNAAQEQLATLSSRVQENLSGMQQVKAFVREKAEKEEFRELSAEYRSRNLALARTRGAIVPLMGSISGIGTLVVLWLGGRNVLQGTMTLGDFIAFNSYLAALAWPTLAMGWIINVFQRGMGALERIGEVIDSPTGRAPVAADAGEPSPAAKEAATAPGIEFRSLTFTYPGARTPALDAVDLRVPAGSTIGIVGGVGSGKSTLLALVAGLYDAPEGSLFIGGRDAARLDLDRRRGMIAFVPQEPFLFSRTIADNIALGKPGAARDEIERMADLARLSEDAGDFPRGYDTIVGERGVTLSGGQRQRVALARALLLDTPVLLLDDTLSAVDAATEAALLRNLRHLTQGKTTLVTTHRYSSIVDADRIVVLDGGRVVETGTHATLLASGGLYARMYRQQQLEEQLESA